jgi:hypothetical protein
VAAAERVACQRIMACAMARERRLFYSIDRAPQPHGTRSRLTDNARPPTRSFLCTLLTDSAALCVLQARGVGSFEYDAVAAIGLLACRIAPHGPLPANFSEWLWAALTERQTFRFDGLSGAVRFENNGNRDPTTVTLTLANLYTSAEPAANMGAPSGAHTFDRTVLADRAYWAPVNHSVPAGLSSEDGSGKSRGYGWSWLGGSPEASGISFLGGATGMPEAIVPVPIAFLQRMSDARVPHADCNSVWAQGRCWLDDGWKAAGAMGILAVDDFNERRAWRCLSILRPLDCPHTVYLTQQARCWLACI